MEWHQLIDSIGWEAIAGFTAILIGLVVTLVKYGSLIWSNFKTMETQLNTHGKMLGNLSKEIEMIKIGDEGQSVGIKECSVKLNNLELLLPDLRKIGGMWDDIREIKGYVRETNGTVIRNSTKIENNSEDIKELFDRINKIGD